MINFRINQTSAMKQTCTCATASYWVRRGSSWMSIARVCLTSGWLSHVLIPSQPTKRLLAVEAIDLIIYFVMIKTFNWNRNNIEINQ